MQNTKSISKSNAYIELRIIHTEDEQVWQEFVASPPVPLEYSHMRSGCYEEKYHEDYLGRNVDTLIRCSSQYPHHWRVRWRLAGLSKSVLLISK
jgi:hypothetical protein